MSRIEEPLRAHPPSGTTHATLICVVSSAGEDEQAWVWIRTRHERHATRSWRISHGEQQVELQYTTGQV
jgi:hypothetical protein